MVHYGTNNDARRTATIDHLNSLVASSFGECTVAEAYAAPSVIKSLNKRGIQKLTIASALDSLKARGCSRIVVQSTMLLSGVMTDMINNAVKQAEVQFDKILVAKPLLSGVSECHEVVSMIDSHLRASKMLSDSNTQVVPVGHGSDSPADATYSQIDYMLKDEGKANWHVGTIEGYPTLQSTKRLLQSNKSKHVILVPLLYIAGNHLYNDINGEWRRQLEAAGYTVDVVTEGLGDMPEIQQLIIRNINQLINQL